MPYDEIDHLDDYKKILARLEEEKRNYIPEIGMRTLQQIDDNIEFFTDKISRLQRIEV
jgi:hypothetical protein